MYARKSSIVSVEISRKRTDDFGTFWGHLRRSALQPLPHVFPLTEPKTCLAFVFLLSFCSVPYKISAESALSVWVPISQVLLPIGRR